MRKLCIDEIIGVKMKKNEEKHILKFEKNIFSLVFFFASLLVLRFKDDL